MDDLKLFGKTEKELDIPLNSGIIFKNITYMEFVINKNIVYQFLEIVKLLVWGDWFTISQEDKNDWENGYKYVIKVKKL